MTRPAVLAWSLCGFALAIAAAGVALHVMSWNDERATGVTPRGFALVLAISFAVTGAFVASRAPHNSVGWIFTVAGVGAAAQYGAEQVAYVVASRPGSILLVPAAVVVLVLGSMNSLVTSIGLLYVFPTGTFLDRRDRIFAFAGIGSWVAVTITTLFVVESLPVPFSGIANPFVRPGAAALAIPIAAPALLVIIASVAMGMRALVRRFSLATGVERQQLKWFVFVWMLAGVTTVLTYVALGIFFITAGPAGMSDPPFLVRLPVWLNIATFVLIAPALGIAILRYHLYDIDILINRALVYGATTAGIAAAFFGGIVLLQAVLRPVTSGSELAVAASTLVSLALFQPLRRRMQDGVDRRFYRSRYDAVRAELVAAARDTMQPAHASVWLRGQP